MDELNTDITALGDSTVWACFYDLGSPSIAQTDKSYFAILSHKTDYRNNDAVAFRSDHINGTYSQLFPIAPLGTRTQ